TNFVLVPHASIVAPDVHATLTLTPQNHVVAVGDSLIYTARIVNRGKAPAFPLASGGGGLTYTLVYPTAKFTNPTAVSVNGTPISNGAGAGQYQISTQGSNTLITCTFQSPLVADGTLPPGASHTATVAVTMNVCTTAACGADATGTLPVQGRITGHATDPSFIAGLSGITGVVPAQT